MNIAVIKNKLADNAKDIKLNLSTVLTEEGAPDLSFKQMTLIALASAYATKNTFLIQQLSDESDTTLNNLEREAAKSAAIIMAMNNIYYRFVHLASDKAYASMPAKLRMNVIANPGISKVDFELMCLAVSAINGCGMCIDAHANALNKEGTTKLAIQSTIRIAAILNATALALEI